MESLWMALFTVALALIGSFTGTYFMLGQVKAECSQTKKAVKGIRRDIRDLYGRSEKNSSRIQTLEDLELADNGNGKASRLIRRGD